MKQPNETAGASVIAQIQRIAVADIVPDPKNQKRTEGLDVLAESIKRDGLLSPIVLRKNPDAKAKAPYMIVAGERRWEAHRLLKAEFIEARIRPDDLADSQLDAVRKRHAENFHREDLSPIQKAKALQELFELKVPQAEIAAFVGAKDQSTVSNLCRLLRLPEKVQQLVHEGKLTAAHAKALLRFDGWKKAIERIAELAIEEGTTSKALEAGLPFGEKLAEDGIVHAFDYNCSELKELPAAYRNDPIFLEGENDWEEVIVYCLDPNKGKMVEAEMKKAREAANARRNGASASSRSGGGDSEESDAPKLSEAELKARKKKLDDNKRARNEVAGTRAKAIQQAKAARRFDIPPETARLLHVVVEAALDDFRHSNRLKEAGAALGIDVPKSISSGHYRRFKQKGLHSLDAVDMLRVAAVAVMMRECGDAERFAAGVPDCAEHIAGGIEKVPPFAQIEKLSPSTHRSIVKELAVAWQTPNKIGEMFGVPTEWVKAIKVDRANRELAGIDLVPEYARDQNAEAAGPKPTPKPVAPAKKVQAASTGTRSGILPAKGATKAAKKSSGGKRAVIDDGVRSEVLKLANAGKTGAEIAKACGISLPSVQNIKKALGLVKAKKGGK